MEQQPNQSLHGANVGVAFGVSIGVASELTIGTSFGMAVGVGTGPSVIFHLPYTPFAPSKTGLAFICWYCKVAWFKSSSIQQIFKWTQESIIPLILDHIPPYMIVMSSVRKTK